MRSGILCPILIHSFSLIFAQADWSDDDDDLGAASDGDSRNKSKDSIQQEQVCSISNHSVLEFVAVVSFFFSE